MGIPVRRIIALVLVGCLAAEPAASVQSPMSNVQGRAALDLGPETLDCIVEQALAEPFLAGMRRLTSLPRVQITWTTFKHEWFIPVGVRSWGLPGGGKWTEPFGIRLRLPKPQIMQMSIHDPAGGGYANSEKVSPASASLSPETDSDSTAPASIRLLHWSVQDTTFPQEIIVSDFTAFLMERIGPDAMELLCHRIAVLKKLQVISYHGVRNLFWPDRSLNDYHSLGLVVDMYTRSGIKCRGDLAKEDIIFSGRETLANSWAFDYRALGINRYRRHGWGETGIPRLDVSWGYPAYPTFIFRDPDDNYAFNAGNANSWRLERAFSGSLSREYILGLGLVTPDQAALFLRISYENKSFVYDIPIFLLLGDRKKYARTEDEEVIIPDREHPGEFWTIQKSDFLNWHDTGRSIEDQGLGDSRPPSAPGSGQGKGILGRAA